MQGGENNHEDHAVKWLWARYIDKNCWIEIFEDEKYDADDPHVKMISKASF
jgi:hypothetical protein